MQLALKWPQFFHKLGSPRWFYRIGGLWLPWLAGLTVALLVTGAVWGLLFAPEDFKQGNSYRIMFVHVPIGAAHLSTTSASFIFQMRLTAPALAIT